jgi:DNA sulfur modification protein DndD
MRFKSLELENFSSYYGKHKVVFNTSKEKPITIIVGGSGEGKTSIFDGLNWGLFGDLYESTLKDESQKEILDYVNVSALGIAKKNDEAVEMSSTVNFEHENYEYRVQHAICVMPRGDKKEITDKSAVLYKVHPNGNAERIANIESFLNEILPNNVRDYFLFNGDRINKLAMPGSSGEIRDGIYRVVDLEILQNGYDHLEAVARKYRKEAVSNARGEMANIEEKYERAYQELDNLEKKRENQKTERRAIEDNIEIVEAKLREMEGVKKDQNKRDVLNERYKNMRSSLKSLIQEIRNTASIAILSNTIPSIDMLLTELDKKREKGEIPSTISTSLLKDILEIKRCICGSEFHEGDVLFAELKRRLEKEQDKLTTGHDLLDLFYDLGTAKNQIENAINKLPNLETKRTDLEQKSLEISKDLKTILERLQDQPEEEISKLAKNLGEFNNDLTNIRISLNQIDTRIKHKEEEIKQLQKVREEMGLKQEKVRKSQLRETLAQKAADELRSIFDQFAEQSRLEVQQLTRDEFTKFIPNVDRFTVGIDSEFHYDVRDTTGQPALQQLSMGQKQTLSLAYITSISRVSEKNPPLVIDMPLGRLDQEVQINVAERLPYLSSQVILLLLPGAEWNEATKRIFSSKTSDLYELNFDKKLFQSSILRRN